MSSPTEKQQTIFCMSWLANTTAGLVDFPEKLQKTATNNITAALADENLPCGGFNLLWGPALDTSSYLVIKALTNNLVYVAKGQNPSGPKTLYVVGVAGTNPISHVGWFNEDLAVGSTIPWPVGADAGVISEGANDGLNVLCGLKSGDPSKTLMNFLLNELKGADLSTVEIAVTGHSLGGALSPVLALKIKQTLDPNNGNGLTVSAWPTAGPTPGNATFAAFLTSCLGQNNYQSVYNSYDAVPHAWQASMLQEIPNLYSNANPPFTNPFTNASFTNYPIIQGITNWAVKQPGSTDYQRSTDLPTFAGTPLPDSSWHTATLASQAQSLLLLHKSDLQTIYAYGGGSGNVQQSDVENMLVFLTEVGYQHVAAYLAYYLNPTQITEIRKYMNTASPSDAAEYLDIENLSDFLSDVADDCNGKS